MVNGQKADRCAHLQAASGAVLCDDADVWRVDARSDEPSQVFVLNISHLNKTTFHSDMFRNILLELELDLTFRSEKVSRLAVKHTAQI